MQPELSLSHKVRMCYEHRIFTDAPSTPQSSEGCQAQWPLLKGKKGFGFPEEKGNLACWESPRGRLLNFNIHGA